jgi:hypothetical protein
VDHSPASSQPSLSCLMHGGIHHHRSTWMTLSLFNGLNHSSATLTGSLVRAGLTGQKFSYCSIWK